MSIENDFLLISVKGKYCQMYESGMKYVEIRKNSPRMKIDTVLIYNTAKKAITIIANIDFVSKIDIAEMQVFEDYYSEYLKQRTGLSLSELYDYLGAGKKLSLLHLKNVEKCKPISLQTLKQKGIKPPQTYRYIKPSILYQCI